HSGCSKDRNSCEHVVQEGGLAASPDCIESFLKSVVKEVWNVQVDILVLFQAQSADVFNVHHQVRLENTRDCQCHVLHVRRHEMRVIDLDRLSPVGNSDRLHRLY